MRHRWSERLATELLWFGTTSAMPSPVMDRKLPMGMRFSLTCLALVVAIRASAQCGTLAPQGPLPLSIPMDAPARGGGPQFIIPTVVHVFYSDIQQPVAPWTIRNSINVANEVLRGTNDDLSDVCSSFEPIIGDLSVELRLAHLDPSGNCISGIVYHYYDISIGAPNITGAAFDPSKYLNIYLYGVSGFSSATIPQPGGDPNDPNDGIFWMQTHASNGRILAHEAGHWLGLYHTFGNSNNPGVACGDDGVLDTPVTMGSPGTCDTTLAVCTPGVVENVDNIMDYSSCRRMFTQGQAGLVAAVMTDLAYPRHMHVTAQNLEDTGVQPEVPCALHVDFHYSVEPSCSNAVVTVVPLVTGLVADQFIWTHAGASMAPNTQASPVLTYTAAGSYPVKLKACAGAVCDSMEQVIPVALNSVSSNGLAIGALPYTEDFENDFAFPDANAALVDNGGQLWQVSAATGYNSAHCIVVPPAPSPLASEQVDVRIGNFDFSGLSMPTVRFKIAATNYPMVRFADVRLYLRDLCDGTLPVGPWYTLSQFYFSGTNTDSSFVPTSPGQWYDLAYGTGQWNLYENAELTIRISKGWLPAPFYDETVYLDNITIGEYDAVMGLEEEVAASDHLVFPNPARGELRVNARANDVLRIADMTGRLVLTRTMRTDQLVLDVSGWSPGAYVLSVDRGGALLHERLVVQ